MTRNKPAKPRRTLPARARKAIDGTAGEEDAGQGENAAPARIEVPPGVRNEAERKAPPETKPNGLYLCKCGRWHSAGVFCEKCRFCHGWYNVELNDGNSHGVPRCKSAENLGQDENAAPAQVEAPPVDADGWPDDLNEDPSSLGVAQPQETAADSIIPRTRQEEAKRRFEEELAMAPEVRGRRLAQAEGAPLDSLRDGWWYRRRGESALRWWWREVSAEAVNWRELSKALKAVIKAKIDPHWAALHYPWSEYRTAKAMTPKQRDRYLLVEKALLDLGRKIPAGSDLGTILRKWRREFQPYVKRAWKLAPPNAGNAARDQRAAIAAMKAWGWKLAATAGVLVLIGVEKLLIGADKKPVKGHTFKEIKAKVRKVFKRLPSQ